MESTTRLDTTGTNLTTMENLNYFTAFADTAVIPTEGDEFIISISRSFYKNEGWVRDENLCDHAQVSISREHAERLVELLQTQLAASE